MKRKKFNCAYGGGDMIILTFTGADDKIKEWQKKYLGCKMDKKIFLKKEKFNLDVTQKLDSPFIHVETYPRFTQQEKDIIKDMLKELK